uniref:Carbohydrate sulfotransferase n=1 Tax=Lutzomyia longipalpis TaxID=7200 RepID=A0A1B0CW14_LUTLO
MTQTERSVHVVIVEKFPRRTMTQNGTRGKRSVLKRRLVVCLKIILAITVFSLYVVVLLRESLQAIEENKSRWTSRVPKTSHHRNTGKHLIHHAWKNSTNHPAPPRPSKPTTLNPIYEYSEEVNAAAERDFAERKNHLWDMCIRRGMVGVYPPNAWEFFISPGHGLAWCNVFKAASSSWMYYFNILGGYNLAYLQRTKTSPLELARQRFPRPTLPELADALANSISFLIVREPFERLLSAYRNKIEGFRNKYYKLLAEQIVKKYRKTPKMKARPTFKEFLTYLIHHYKSGNRFDEHWSPIYSFCTPCSINYTLIAKVETFQRDTEYIIRQAGLETLLLNKLPNKKVRAISNRSTSDTRHLIPKYFGQIDAQTLDQIIEIYEPDFEFFGYNFTKYYELIEQN